MKELTKTIDLECYLISLSNLFIGPSHFEIKDNILYLAYTQKQVIKKFIESNTIVCETDLAEQELYNELVGDDENIYEQDIAEYIKQLQDRMNQFNIYRVITNTILNLYEMELRGFIIPSININNTIFGEEHLQFMDNYLHSRSFEISLEEYLITDYIRLPTPQISDQVKQLAIIFIQLLLLIQLDYQRNINEYIDLIKQYHSDSIGNLIDIMYNGNLKYFTQVMKQQQYIDMVSPIDALTSKAIFKEFFEAKKLQSQAVWDRIELRFQSDQYTTLWEQELKTNLKFLQPIKQQAQYRIEHKIITVQSCKINEQVTSLQIVNIQVGINYQRCVIMSSLSGDLIIADKNKTIKQFKCSTKSLRCLIKFKYIDQVYIGTAGDDGIIYIFEQSQLSQDQPQTIIKLQQNAQITCLATSPTYLLSGTNTGVLFIYKKWQQYNELQIHSDKINKLVYHNDFIYSSSMDNCIKILNGSTFQTIQILTGHVNNISNFIVLNDSIYSFSNDGMMRMALYRDQQYQFVYQMKFNNTIESVVELTQNSLLLGDSTGAVLIYSIDRKLEYQLKIHLGGILGLLWHSKAANYFISVGRDQVLKLIEYQN